MSQYTKSLLHFNGANNSTTFTDETRKVWTRHGDAKISTAQSKFGGASGCFSAGYDYISTPEHTNFAFGTGEFTIECWLRVTSFSYSNYVLHFGSSLALCFHYGFLVTGLGTDIETFWAPSVNTWCHIAVTRDGSSNVRIFGDGTQRGVTTFKDNSIVSGGLLIGTRSDGLYPLLGYIDELRISNIARWTANFTPPTSEYSIGLALNVVIDSPENIREVINRIAYEASSMEYWDAGQHNLVYLPTHTTVSKTIDANRIDLGTISVGYTDRVDLLNSMILWYRHYWSGYSGDAAFRKSVSDSDATSITEFGTLSSEPLQFKYLGNTNDTPTLDNAQRAIRWILTQQKNPRVTVEFTGGYYLTDLTRSNLIQFSFTAGDELDKAFSGLVSTSDKFIIMDIVRGTGQIKIKAVQLIAL